MKSLAHSHAANVGQRKDYSQGQPDIQIYTCLQFLAALKEEPRTSRPLSYREDGGNGT